LLSAYGSVYSTSKNHTDYLIDSSYNLKAVGSGSNTWQFRSLDASYQPYLGFGIGTVGNSDLGVNNFNGNIVGNIDYAIYTGDITTQNLHNKKLVKNSATFVFSGLTGFNESNILPSYAFGLGTSPDSMLVYSSTVIPEPSTVAILALGCLLFRKRK